MGEIKKAPQSKIFVIGTIFTPEIAQKCKKWPTENPGGPVLDLIWKSPSYHSLNRFNSNFSKTRLQIPRAGADTGGDKGD